MTSLFDRVVLEARLTKPQRRALEYYVDLTAPDPVINFPWRPDTLQALAAKGLLRVHEHPTYYAKRKYSITNAGRKALGLEEQFPNAPWWKSTMQKDPHEPHELAPKPSKLLPPRRKLVTVDAPPEDAEQPMDNPLPGNMSPRAAKRAQGTRLQRMRGPRPPR